MTLLVFNLRSQLNQSRRQLVNQLGSGANSVRDDHLTSY